MTKFRWRGSRPRSSKIKEKGARASRRIFQPIKLYEKFPEFQWLNCWEVTVIGITWAERHARQQVKRMLVGLLFSLVVLRARGDASILENFSQENGTLCHFNYFFLVVNLFKFRIIFTNHSEILDHQQFCPC